MITMKQLLLVTLSCCLFMSGCSYYASVTYDSVPQGATLIEDGTGVAYGPTPVTINYVLSREETKDGTWTARPLTAKWVSGAEKKIDNTRFKVIIWGAHNYSSVINRPSEYPGVDVDMQFARDIEQSILSRQQLVNEKKAIDAQNRQMMFDMGQRLKYGY